MARVSAVELKPCFWVLILCSIVQAARNGQGSLDSLSLLSPLQPTPCLHAPQPRGALLNSVAFHGLGLRTFQFHTPAQLLEVTVRPKVCLCFRR